MRRRGQTWAYWELSSSSKRDCKVYYEIRQAQLVWSRLYPKMTASYLTVSVTNESESKCSIIDKPLSQKRSTDENKWRSTEEDELECSKKKQNYAKNLVSYDVTNCLKVSNVWECGRDNPDVQCERACMANVENDYLFERSWHSQQISRSSWPKIVK